MVAKSYDAPNILSRKYATTLFRRLELQFILMLEAPTELVERERAFSP